MLWQSTIHQLASLLGVMCHRMLYKGKGKSATVYLAAAVILMCYLGQTVDCNRLTETEWRKEVNAARRIGFKEGQIVFGSVFQKGSGLGPQVIDRTNESTSNTIVEEDAEYQADFAGWVKGQTQNGRSREAAWKRMSPSLQCGWDQLKFRAVGPGASQFAVEQANAPPLPLSQVPSTCGYIMQRNSFGLVILVPYDGCNMVQKDGSYVLPMRWQGHPFSLWCPKPPAPQHQYPFGPQGPTPEPETTTTTTPPPPPTIALPEGPHHFFKYPFDHKYPFNPYYPFNPQYPTPEAEMTPPVALPEGHHHHPSHKYPSDRQYVNPYYPFNPQYPTPEAEMTPPVALPEGHHHHHHHSHKYPFDRQYSFNPYYPFHPQYPTPESEMTPPVGLPEGHHHHYILKYPFYPYYPQYPTPEAETTPPVALPEGHHHHHILKYPFYPYYPQYPTPEAETTPPVALPEGHHHSPEYPFDRQYPFNPYYPFNPQYPTPEPETTPPMTLPEGHHHSPEYPFDCQYPFNPYYPFFPQYPAPEPEMTPAALPERHHVVSHKHPFNPYFPFNTQYPTPETTTTMKKN